MSPVQPAATFDEVAAMLETEEGQSRLALFFGDAAVRAMVQDQESGAGRLIGHRHDVVVLPGLMGSLLRNTQGLGELLWINPRAILQGHLNRLQMAPDGQHDADPAVTVAPAGLEFVVYTRLMLVLRTAGRVLAFPYDWRRDIRQSAARLRDAIDRWIAGDPPRKLTLIGHSMGGLVARAYLALFPAHAGTCVERVIMLGTPMRGSLEAVFSLAAGNSLMDMLARLNNGNQALAMVRSLPGLYQLLPPPPEFFPAQFSYPVDFDLYAAAAWPAGSISQLHLDRAREFHGLLAGTDPQAPLVQIAGCNVPSRVAASLHDSRLTSTIKSSGQDGGDGTVPLWSSRLSAGETYYVQAGHMNLPREDAVISAVMDLLQGRPPDLDTSVPESRGPAPGAAPAFDAESESESLRTAIETSAVTAADLEKFYFVLR